MIFQAPIMLLLLAILPILGKILARAHLKQNVAAAKLRGEKKSSNHWKKTMACQLSAFAALIVALAQPAWNPRPGPPQMQGRDLIIALDISRSMLADDVFPSRLEAVKIALFEGLDSLRGQRIGLITFAGSASMGVPLTLDHNFLRYMLKRAQPSDADVGSTSLQAAIEKALDTALSDSKKGDQDILLFTDGEDLISDIDKTADELRESGARVLIVGLGDPVAGANIPDIENPEEWMRNKDGSKVVTRLDEKTLHLLSENSPNVIYYSAQTRPFDLLQLYDQLIADTAGLPVRDESRLIYTDGYPFFIALALLLWLVPLNKRLFPVLALMLMAGCSEKPFHPLETDIEAQLEQGRDMWAAAQETLETDPSTTLFTLQEARAAFLQAALIAPGSRSAAEQIAGISIQIHTVEEAILAQEEAEKDLQKKMQEAVEQLQELTQRETALSKQSQRLLNKRPPIPPEEKAAAVEPARMEQVAVKEGTGTVLETVTDVQQLIRKMLAPFAGEPNPPTELDGVVTLLGAATGYQQTGVESLEQEGAKWPPANSAFRSAAGRMQEALKILAQSSGQSGDESDEMSDDSEMDDEYDEDMEWSESDMPANMSAAMQAGNFKADLEARSLPIPNYTSEEILTEEEANMEQRSQQKAKQAGAKVEKNW